MQPRRPAATLAFGQLLLSYRQARGLSGSACAREVGIDASYLSRLERGEREPPTNAILARICGALALTPDQSVALWLAAGRIPQYDATVAAVVQVLALQGLREEQRRAFRTGVEALVALATGRV